MIKNSKTNYGSVSKFFHWTMAFLIILIFTIGYIMTNIPKSSGRLTLYDFHKATGLLVLSLCILRLSWSVFNIKPSLPNHLSPIMKFIVKYSHMMLYFLMIGMPVSGFLISTLGGYRVTIYYLFTIQPFTVNKYLSHFFSNIHQLLAYTLAAVVILHVMGALFHHFIIKDNILKRMWIFNTKGEDARVKSL